MKRGNDIRDELTELGSFLADIPNGMPYAVPEGYFGHLATSVREIIIDLDVAEDVPGWSKVMPYVIPANYFETLADEIKSRAGAADLPKNKSFAVPAGYFEALPAQLLRAAKDADRLSEPKVIPLRRFSISRQIRWAAAAVLVAGIGLGSYFSFFNTNKTDADILASVSSSEIEDYVQRIYRIDAERIVSNTKVADLQLDNNDIIEYLNETGWD